MVARRARASLRGTVAATILRSSSGCRHAATERTAASAHSCMTTAQRPGRSSVRAPPPAPGSPRHRPSASRPAGAPRPWRAGNRDRCRSRPCGCAPAARVGLGGTLRAVAIFLRHPPRCRRYRHVRRRNPATRAVPVAGPHQPHLEADAVARHLGGALHDVARFELLAGNLDVGIRRLEQERGGARHHAETSHAGQRNGDLVGQSRCEEVLRRVAGVVARTEAPQGVGPFAAGACAAAAVRPRESASAATATKPEHRAKFAGDVFMCSLSPPGGNTYMKMRPAGVRVAGRDGMAAALAREASYHAAGTRRSRRARRCPTHADPPVPMRFAGSSQKLQVSSFSMSPSMISVGSSFSS